MPPIFSVVPLTLQLEESVAVPVVILSVEPVTSKAPLAVSVVLDPLQIVLFPATVTVGVGLTFTVTVAGKLVHPPTSVTRSVYVVVVVGAEVVV